MMSSRICPEAATMVGALVKPFDKSAVPGTPKGMSVVMEYKVNSSGEWVCFALDPDRWFDLSHFKVISRK
tara:strand:- start:120 stop:329 length:210 start_codon:yes stop_codon:yes gene_type:complete